MGITGRENGKIPLSGEKERYSSLGKDKVTEKAPL